MKYWIFLFIAIIAETIGTTALKSTDGFTKFVPVVAVILGYATSFYFLSLTLKVIPIGIAYAVWSGAGIILISAISYFYFHQDINLIQMIGILFIVIGMVFTEFVFKIACALIFKSQIKKKL